MLSVQPQLATLELSMEELGLIMNAIWQDLGYQQARSGPPEDEIRASYDLLQQQIGDVIARMDAAARA